MGRDREIAWLLLLATLASTAGCFGVRFHDPVYEPTLGMPWQAISEFSAKKSCHTGESSLADSAELPANKPQRPVLPAWSAPPHSKFHPVPARPVFAPASVAYNPPMVAVREIRSPELPSRAPSDIDGWDSPLELNAPARLSDASIDEATPIR